MIPLSGAISCHAAADYVSFRQTNLEGASLKSADIKSCDFREAKGLSLEQSA